MTGWLIKGWIVLYMITVVSALIEHKWLWALYYFGAALISVAVLLMGVARQ